MAGIRDVSQIYNSTNRKITGKLSFNVGDSFSAKILNSSEDGKEVTVRTIDGWQFPAILEEPLDLLPESLVKFQVLGYDKGEIKLKLVPKEQGEKTSEEESLLQIAKNNNLGEEDIRILKSMTTFSIPLDRENISKVKSLVDFQNKINKDPDEIDQFILKYLKSNQISSESKEGIEITNTLRSFFEEFKEMSLEEILFFQENGIELTEDNIKSYRDLFEKPQGMNNSLKNIIDTINSSQQEKSYNAKIEANGFTKSELFMDKDLSNEFLQVYYKDVEVEREINDNYRDINKDSNKEINRDNHQDISKDNYKEVNKDNYKEIIQGNYEELSNDNYKEIGKENFKEINIDDYKEINHKEINKDNYKETLSKINNNQLGGQGESKVKSSLSKDLDEKLNQVIMEEVAVPLKESEEEVKFIIKEKIVSKILEKIEESIQTKGKVEGKEIINFIKDDFKNTPELKGFLKEKDVENMLLRLSNNKELNELMDLKRNDNISKMVLNQVKDKIEELKTMVKNVIDAKSELDPKTWNGILNSVKANINDIKIFNTISGEYYYIDIPVKFMEDDYPCKLIIKDDRKKGKRIDSNNVKMAVSVSTIKMGKIDIYIDLKERNMKLDFKCEEQWVKVLDASKERLYKILVSNNYNVSINVSEREKEMNFANCREFFQDTHNSNINVVV
ncbi:hypothetical protein N3C_1768 [Clostridium sp. N3C]|uniref:hypothetical protein n=1 Tax=Clostridium sp. N3C TaxID=1776758 RepID=UPI00092E1903|nr:hypothetical protein [Clostridium sp. N3C]SCN24312.1 hypothetical protein N3C_1768 [Clostridium sp. N3C]